MSKLNSKNFVLSLSIPTLPHWKMSQRVNYLSLDSTQDTNWNTSDHNPADFTVRVPNNKLTGVSRICFTDVSIPRLFDIINENNNTLIWWQRQVIEPPVTGMPNNNLRTVSNTWTATRTLQIPTGRHNITSILAVINAATGGSEVWSYDSVNGSLVISKTPSGVPIDFKQFVDGAHVDPAVSYADMTYVSGGTTESLDTLGLQKAADQSSRLEDKLDFDQRNPNSFDAVKGSNLQGVYAFPLFNREAHDYKTWATAAYTTPLMNPPCLTGPQQIQVTLSELGDGGLVSAGTGVSYDVITTVDLSQVPIGTNAIRHVTDSEAQSIGYLAPREVRAIRVRLLDRKFRPLTLPRNYPVNVTVQLQFTER